MIGENRRADMQQTYDRKKVWSWAFYDWALSAHTTTIVAGFFPVFYKQYWAGALDASTSSFYLGLTHSLSGLIIALMAPALGAIADKGALKIPLLLIFSLLGFGATLGLFFIGAGAWPAALWVFGISMLGYGGAMIFYDALLVHVAPAARAHGVSSLGYGLGYLGGGLLFAINIAMVMQPQVFGLADNAAAVRWSFVTVAAWWALFSLPIFLWVREPRPAVRPPLRAAVIGGFRELAATFREVRKLKPVFIFLLAYWLYIDGVGTIIRMAIDFGMNLGFDGGQLMLALLITQFVAFPASLFFGYLARRLGAKTGIFIAIGGYIAISLWTVMVTAIWEFFAIAVAIGCVQGGIQALSRSFYARLIPAERAGEFFGFYNMLGKFAAVLGPVMMGAVAALSGPRYSVLALLVLFIAGAALLTRVHEPQAAK